MDTSNTRVTAAEQDRDATGTELSEAIADSFRKRERNCLLIVGI